MITGSTLKFSSGTGLGTVHSSVLLPHGFAGASRPRRHELTIAHSRTACRCRYVRAEADTKLPAAKMLS